MCILYIGYVLHNIMNDSIRFIEWMSFQMTKKGRIWSPGREVDLLGQQKTNTTLKMPRLP